MLSRPTQTLQEAGPEGPRKHGTPGGRVGERVEGSHFSGQEAVVMSGSADPGPEQLLQHAKAGDQQALGQMLERYRAFLGVLARVQIGRAAGRGGQAMKEPSEERRGRRGSRPNSSW